MKSKIFIVMIVAVLMLSLIVSSCTGASPTSAPASEGPIELKLAHHDPPPASLNARGISNWVEKLEKAANGKIKVTVYPAQTLCKLPEEINAVESGLADIVWLLISGFPGRFPLVEVTTLPFMQAGDGTIDNQPRNSGEINSRILNELYESIPEMQAQYAGLNAKVLFHHTTPAFHLMSMKKPVRSLDDLKGLKVRSIAGPNTEMWKKMGAVPLSMPMPAIYENAQKGVIEAAVADWGATMAFKFYELFEYVTNTPLTLAQFVVLMNKDRWDSLSPDIQEAIMSVSTIADAETVSDRMGMPREAAEAEISKAGYKMEVFNLDPEEIAEWQKIGGQPIWDQWLADMEAKGLPGQKAFDETLRLIEKYK